MRRWRLILISLSAMVLTSACLGISRRSAEQCLAADVQNGGFSIGMGVRDSSGPIIPVNDAESADKLLQWFQRRPRSMGRLDTMVVSALAESLPFPTITIETTRTRIAVTMFAVVSETRQSSDDPWKKEVWKIRKEDVEFREWATGKVTAILEPAMRGMLERGEISEEFDWEQVNSLLRNDNGNSQALDPAPHQQEGR